MVGSKPGGSRRLYCFGKDVAAAAAGGTVGTDGRKPGSYLPEEQIPWKEPERAVSGEPHARVQAKAVWVAVAGAGKDGLARGKVVEEEPIAGMSVSKAQATAVGEAGTEKEQARAVWGEPLGLAAADTTGIENTSTSSG